MNPLKKILAAKEEELKKARKDLQKEQPNNPMHAVRLKDVMELLVTEFGWEGLSEKINIRCFAKNPSMNSSLTFLRSTPWARTKVERLYLRTLKKRKS